MTHLLIIDAPNTRYFPGTDMQVPGPFSRVCHVQGVAAAMHELADADVLIVCHGNQLQRQHIAQLRRCRGIVIATTGTDHVDVDAASEHGIPVCHLPDYGVDEVADHALLLMLACVRRLSTATTIVRYGQWDWGCMRRVQRLRGQTLGIVGLGRIGRAMATRGLALGMDVLYHDPYVDARTLAHTSLTGVRRAASLIELATTSHVISLHCPLTEQTHQLLDSDLFSLMRRGTVIINTARGGLIDQTALIDALAEGTIGAAGLDVLANEPRIPEALRSNERVLMTPHAGFCSEQSLQQMREMALAAASNIAEGRVEHTALLSQARTSVEGSDVAAALPATHRDPAITATLLRYAGLLASRSLVCNTFGNIGIRHRDVATGREVIHTKHMGVSLEEMTAENVVVMDLETDALLIGNTRPSIGHQMHREVFRLRPDVGAVIHLHPDEVIAYFSLFHEEGTRYISNDTALVMQAPVEILAPDINIEIDLEPLGAIVQTTNCIVMPQHGITTFGRTVSEAYHRACSMVAETRRLMLARMLAQGTDLHPPYVSDASVQDMFRIGMHAIYGPHAEPALAGGNHAHLRQREPS